MGQDGGKDGIFEDRTDRRHAIHMQVLLHGATEKAGQNAKRACQCQCTYSAAREGRQ